MFFELINNKIGTYRDTTELLLSFKKKKKTNLGKYQRPKKG